MLPNPAALRRQPFAAADEVQARVLELLLAQDGSATRLCEAVAGGPIEVHVLAQQATEAVPRKVRELLPGGRFIERLSCLAAHGEVLLDSVSWIALAGLEPDIEADLRAGRRPIGHLLQRLWVRREPLADAGELGQRLWHAVGAPDAAATRAFRVVTPQGARMIVVETYRRGMLMGRAATPPAAPAR